MPQVLITTRRYEINNMQPVNRFFFCDDENDCLDYLQFRIITICVSVILLFSMDNQTRSDYIHHGCIDLTTDSHPPPHLPCCGVCGCCLKPLHPCAATHFTAARICTSRPPPFSTSESSLITLALAVALSPP